MAIMKVGNYVENTFRCRRTQRRKMVLKSSIVNKNRTQGDGKLIYKVKDIDAKQKCSKRKRKSCLFLIRQFEVM